MSDFVWNFLVYVPLVVIGSFAGGAYVQARHIADTRVRCRCNIKEQK